MGSITITNLGKAYKQYSTRWGRLAEWLLPGNKKRHSLHWVLQDINFTVNPGEAVGIIGVNGAGKSTLLKMITGTTQPTTGSVNISGRMAALLELGMGFHPDFTGRQNAFMAGQILGMNVEDISRLMPEIEAFAEIGDYIDQPVRVYSSGMQVRLAFAVATAARPDILIVDEALSVGDTYFQHKCFARIRQFQEQGTTLLFVSHDLAVVRALCVRSVWLDNGAIREVGETKIVLDAYATAIYAKEQDVESAAKKSSDNNQTLKKLPKLKRDCRLEYINNSNLRNDIEIFEFDEKADKWGDGQVRITDTCLHDVSGNTLSWVIGGEEVLLVVQGIALNNLDSAIVGFQVRDRLGQIIFGDNTYVSTLDNPVSIKKGCIFSAKFRFLMPILPKGTYAVTSAVVAGSQQKHVVHEWINDALFFESHNMASVSGMVGVPMHDIQFES